MDVVQIDEALLEDPRLDDQKILIRTGLSCSVRTISRHLLSNGFVAFNL